MTKPEDQSWRDYIAKNFKNPREEIGAICITSPDSLTGRYTGPAVMQELISIAKEYGIKVVLNQVHAVPGLDGKLPETQRLIAESKDPNLFLMSSATKQLMPYDVPGLENSLFNIFYSPSSDLIARTREEVAKILGPDLEGEAAAQRVIGLATQLMEASTREFYAKNEQRSFEKRRMVQDWISKHPGVNWYKGHVPDTMYNGTLTFSHELIAKTGIKNPIDLYNYLLFTTGLDVGPVFEAGPDNLNAEGGASMRMNYSLPDSELRLALDLLGVAADNMARGTTLAQVIRSAERRGSVRLRAEKT
jgi:bifunctional pyridoxal-dependent enzyme with beta-cystathionase and maltose regulon repressor activities